MGVAAAAGTIPTSRTTSRAARPPRQESTRYHSIETGRWSSYLLRAKLGWMVGQRLVLSLVIATLLGLVPLAHTTPPDQTWLAGLYDSNDYDDAVIFLTSVVAVVNPDPAPALERLPLVVGPASQARQPVASAPRPAAYHLRAPPLA